MLDQAFITLIQSGEYPSQEWNHIAHLRLAWFFLRWEKFEKAKAIIHATIKKYNEHHEKSLLIGYQEGLTNFWINKVQRIMGQYPSAETFQQFYELAKELQTSVSDQDLKKL